MDALCENIVAPWVAGCGKDGLLVPFSSGSSQMAAQMPTDNVRVDLMKTRQELDESASTDIGGLGRENVCEMKMKARIARNVSRET